MDVPAGVTQEEGHTVFVHLPSAVFAIIFSREKDSAVPCLVDRRVEFCVLTTI